MIEHLEFRNFLAFDRFAYPAPSSLTLVIGPNDTGKTGLLKLVYATARTLVEIQRSRRDRGLKSRISEKLLTTFMPRRNGLGELVRKGASEGFQSKWAFRSGGEEALRISYSFTEHAQKEVGDVLLQGGGTVPDQGRLPLPEGFNALFVPAKEVLTVFRVIAFTRRNFEFLEFDDTYLDLVEALEIPTRSGRVYEPLKEVNTKLEQLFEGEIVQNLDDPNNPFLFRKGNQKYSMPLTAEGIKKVGILTTLIRNRELGRNTMLFLDEPETALHPGAQRQFAEMLFSISQMEGVQVWLATHSYFMVNQFTNIARREQQALQCISLTRAHRQPTVSCSIHDLQAGLPENSIIDEALAAVDDFMND